jgi:PAS domain-containing protein
MGAFDCDLIQGAMWWDGRTHEFFGVKPGGFSGNYDDFLALVQFEDRPRLAREELTASLGQSPEIEVGFRIIHPSDGAVRFLEMRFKARSDVQGRPQRIIGVCQDVTEQRSTEAALVRERYFLSTMIDTLPDLIYFKDRESRFTRVNRSFLSRAGFQDQLEILGKMDKDLYASSNGNTASRPWCKERRLCGRGSDLEPLWRIGRALQAGPTVLAK